jgi:hypothetical protein
LRAFFDRISRYPIAAGTKSDTKFDAEGSTGHAALMGPGTKSLAGRLFRQVSGNLRVETSKAQASEDARKESRIADLSGPKIA